MLMFMYVGIVEAVIMQCRYIAGGPGIGEIHRGKYFVQEVRSDAKQADDHCSTLLPKFPGKQGGRVIIGILIELSTHGLD